MLRAKLHSAFTLVEVLVSCAILIILMGIIFAMIQQTSKVYRGTLGQVNQFRRARDAFSIITQRIGSATLNTYWNVETSTTGTSRYARQSELRFRAGPTAGPSAGANNLIVSGSYQNLPGTAIFFQAPTGIFSGTSASTSTSTGQLKEALNTWGYFVEYGSDATSRPGFFDTITPPIPLKYRFRLYEMVEPADQLSIYQYTSGLTTSGSAKSSAYIATDWFSTAFGNRNYNPSQPAKQTARVLADNVIVALFLARLPSSEDTDPLTTGFTLATGFNYDSTNRSIADPKLNPKNQLPPVVEVILVCLNEESSSTYNWPTTVPDFGPSKLMDATKIITIRNLAELQTELDILIKTLRDKRIDARAFRTAVGLKSAKWSTQQSN